MKSFKSILAKRNLVAEKVDDPDKIDNKEELYDYVEAILKKAHGDKYDPKKSKSFIDSLIKKHGVDKSGAIVGIVQNSVSESVDDPDIDLMRGIFDNIDNLGMLSEEWVDVNRQTPHSKMISSTIKGLSDVAERYAEHIFRIPELPQNISLHIDESDVANKKLSALIKRTDEFKELRTQFQTLDNTLNEMSYEDSTTKMLKNIIFGGIEKLITLID